MPAAVKSIRVIGPGLLVRLGATVALPIYPTRRSRTLSKGHTLFMVLKGLQAWVVDMVLEPIDQNATGVD